MAACKYGDPLCPCQDGDACHYEPQGKGQGKTLPMLVRPEFTLRAIGQANTEGYIAGHVQGQVDFRTRVRRIVVDVTPAEAAIRAACALPIIEEKEPPA